MQRQTRLIVGTALFAALSAAAVAAGVRALVAYESAPGETGVVPRHWPGVQLPADTGRTTLVMFAHPLCPCTRATIGELAQVMARVQGRVDAYVFFVKPADAGPEWQEGALRRSAAAIPGVTVLNDDGTEAARFGARTSGHTLLFAGDGQLLFSGGITQSRGHMGDNAGASAVVSLVREGAAERASTFVFGCSLPE